MHEFKTIILFLITALVEIIGCYLPYLWIIKNKSILLLIPGILCLILFSWLLTLHPTATGKTYATYGGIYIFVAIIWLWLIDGIKPSIFDLIGVFICLIGVIIIIYGEKFK